MIYLSVFSFMVTLIMGLALLLLWRRYPVARFTRDIGLYYLALAITPLLFAFYSQAGPLGQTVLLWGTIAFGSVYLTLLVLGMVHLAHREISRARIAAILLGLSLFMGYTLLQHSWPFASAASGVITFSVGALTPPSSWSAACRMSSLVRKFLFFLKTWAATITASSDGVNSHCQFTTVSLYFRAPNKLY